MRKSHKATFHTGLLMDACSSLVFESIRVHSRLAAGRLTVKFDSDVAPARVQTRLTCASIGLFQSLTSDSGV